MPAPDSFHLLVSRLRDGDNAAAEEVFRRFTASLVGVARNHLDGLLRGKVDPEDVVQSVYRSFFLRVREGQYELTSWEGLWGLLSRITANKCVNRMNYFRAGKRDAALESSPGDHDLLQQVLDPAPTPEEAVILVETVQRLLGELDEARRGILELLLQGHTPPEISATTGLSESTVRRTRERTRKKLARWIEDSGR